MKFKQLLDSKELTRYKLHKLTGIYESTIGNYYNGKRDPLRMPLEQAYLISKQLDMSLNEFYNSLLNEEN